MTDRFTQASLEALADFMAARLADATSTRVAIMEGVRSGKIQMPGTDLAYLEVANREGIEGALAMEALLEETIRPYLGDDGPAGRIAERQLRLLARSEATHRDYREDWLP